VDKKQRKKIETRLRAIGKLTQEVQVLFRRESAEWTMGEAEKFGNIWDAVERLNARLLDEDYVLPYVTVEQLFGEPQ